MVAKKKAAKKKRASKQQGKELISAAAWEKELAQHAQQQQAVEVTTGTGSKIGKKNGKFSYQGTNIGPEMIAVILGFSFENTWYGGIPYDPDNPQPPVCFAIADNDLTLEPHENSVDVQNESCAGCWANEFGSSDNGRGKACKNGRRLALLEYYDGVNIDEADVALLTLSPTELKNWKKYMRDLEDRYGRPTLGVVTRLFFEDSGGDQDIVNFEIEEIVKPAEGGAILRRLKEAEELLHRPYQPRQEEDTTSTRKKKVTKKKATKKKAATKKTKRKSRLA